MVVNIYHLCTVIFNVGYRKQLDVVYCRRMMSDKGILNLLNGYQYGNVLNLRWPFWCTRH